MKSRPWALSLSLWLGSRACPELNTSSESRVAVVNNTLRIDVPTYNGRDESPPDLVSQVLEPQAECARS